MKYSATWYGLVLFLKKIARFAVAKKNTTINFVKPDAGHWWKGRYLFTCNGNVMPASRRSGRSCGGCAEHCWAAERHVPTHLLSVRCWRKDECCHTAARSKKKWTVFGLSWQTLTRRKHITQLIASFRDFEPREHAPRTSVGVQTSSFVYTQAPFALCAWEHEKNPRPGETDSRSRPNVNFDYDTYKSDLARCFCPELNP